MQLARVQCFTKSGRMNPKRWRIAICIDSILVMTAQQLLNNLAVRAASLQQIDLLVRPTSLVPRHTPLSIVSNKESLEVTSIAFQSG